MSSVVLTTLGIGALAPLIAVIIGWPLGLALRGSIRRSRGLQVALLAPQVLSPVVSSYGWFKGLKLFGFTYGLTTVIVVCALGVLPWIVLQVALTPLPDGLVDVSRTLGARRWARWRQLLLPLSQGAIVSAALQGALWCLCSFTVVVTLGGGPAVETLEVVIFQKLRSQWDPTGALAAAGVQLALAIALTGVATRIARPAAQSFETESQRIHAIEGLMAWGCALLFLVPFFAAVPSWFNIVNLNTALRDAAGPFGRSLLCASFVTVGSGVAAVALSRFRSAQKFWFLVTGVSPVAVGLLIWFAIGRIWDPFAGSLTPVILIQIVIFGGLAARVWQELLGSRPLESFAIARTLGASPRQVLRHLEWPRIRQPFLAALALVFSFSLVDVSVTRVIGSTEVPLFGAYLMQIAGSYRIDEALALGSLGSLLGIAALIFGGRWP